MVVSINEAIDINDKPAFCLFMLRELRRVDAVMQDLINIP